jgi:SAM-dependent methyltransferase
MADKQHIEANTEAFGDAYCGADVFRRYPETKIIPAYLKAHFADARVVLDLGFGTGVWFWASFLPALERIDGIDVVPEVLAEADQVFAARTVPSGYRLAHEQIGERFTLGDLKQLKKKRGRFFFQDYRQSWPEAITGTRYDLVTEHGGGLGQMSSEGEVVEVISRAAAVLRPGGRMLLVNFRLKRAPLEEETGQPAPAALHLSQEMFLRTVERAGLRMIDFHAADRPADMSHVQTFYYGYAQR